MLENASELSAAAGKQIVTRQHAAEALPYDDESFDAVTCRVAAHHFSSPAAFVSESVRVLKRGGYFLLIDGTVPDDEPDAALWMNTVEKLRDSSHARLLSPGEWQQLCIDAGLFLQRIEITRMHQPDLTWYFKTAATRDENRQKVIELYESASPHLRSIFNICTVDGRRTWKWHRLQLLARR